MKKAVLILVSLVLLLSFAGCGKDGGVNETRSQKETEDPQGPVEPVALTGEAAGEIRVSCFDTMVYKDFLESAAESFEAKYPGTKVSVETFSEMPEIKTSETDEATVSVMSSDGSQADKSDYINKVNTELMSGAGADIFALDVLPVHRYIENGQLENLKAYMDGDADFNKDSYRTNIFDALTDGGRMFVFPLDFSFNYLAYDSSLPYGDGLEALKTSDGVTFKQMLDAGRAFSGGADSVFSTDDAFLFRELMKMRFNDFVDIKTKKANFTDGSFAGLLNEVKGYTDEGLIKPSKTSRGEITPESFTAVKDEKVMFKLKDGFLLAGEFSDGGFMGISPGNNHGDTENDELLGVPKSDGGNVIFKLNQAYGINADSTNKRTAWEFIKFLAGEEMQSSANLFGLPVNRSAFLEKARLLISGAMFYAQQEETELTPEQQTALDSYASAAEKYIGMLNYCYLPDSYIGDTIDEEAQNFFGGTKTADETAETLQNKISLYLNE